MIQILKVNLALFGKTLVYQVEEQNDKYILRGGKKLFTASNGYEVWSHGNPEIRLGSRVIYLQGEDRTEDNIVVTFEYAAVEKARKAKAEILAALGEFTHNLDTPPLNDIEPNTYVFMIHGEN